MSRPLRGSPPGGSGALLRPDVLARLLARFESRVVVQAGPGFGKTTALTQDLEPRSGLADPSSHALKFRAIRGLPLSIEEVRATYEFGGNVDVEHRQAVADCLTERAGPGDLATPAHMAGVVT